MDNDRTLDVFKAQQIFKKAYGSGDIRFDTKGHFRNGANSFRLIERVSESLWFLDRKKGLMSDEFADVFAVITGKLKRTKFVRMRPFHHEECTDCGRMVDFETNGKVVRAIGKPCKYPNGIPEYSVQIDVPSGELVFANDLRAFFPVYDYFNVNLKSETKRCTEAYSKEQCAHVYVGNSCPSVHRLDERSLVLGVYADGADGEVWDEKKEDFVKIPEKEATKRRLPGEYVASVCTDLWWYSACDLSILKERFEHFNKNPEFTWDQLMKHCDVVKVEPGRYEFSARKHLCDDSNFDEPAVYSRIRRVGPAKRKRAKIAAPPAYGVEDTLAHMKRSYPNLYPHRYLALSHLFCTIGGGYRWVNGILLNDKVKGRGKAEWAPVPEGEKVSFYPISEYSKCLNVPGDVRPDWLEAVRETMEMVIAKDAGDHRKNNVKMAKKVLKDLRKRFK